MNILKRALYRRDDRGQTLVIAGLSFIVLVALVGLVLDGGFAWGKQRETQNGADSAAKAGTIVIQHSLAELTTPTDGTVGCAVEDAADENAVDLTEAQYTNANGQVLGPVGGCGAGGAIPTGAQGVKATTEQTFDTFVAGIFGMDTFKAVTDATAVVASTVDVCPADAGCGALPVTFPQTFDMCDGSGDTYSLGEDDEDGVWEPYEILPADAVLGPGNLAILPLCPDNPGSVGWLDFGCGNLSSHITDPCNDAIPIPSWEQTHTGNINCCESDLNALTGSQRGVAEEEDKVVMIPIHDNTCSGGTAHTPPADIDPTCMPIDEEWSGEGNNNFFHMNFWIGFKIDEAHVTGADNECEELEGAPLMEDASGGLGCLKGWIVSRFDAPSTVQVGPITPGLPVTTLVVLID